MAVLYVELKYKFKLFTAQNIYFIQTSGLAIYFGINEQTHFIFLGPGSDFSLHIYFKKLPTTLPFLNETVTPTVIS